jgi:hypothetical protein
MCLVWSPRVAGGATDDRSRLQVVELGRTDFTLGSSTRGCTERDHHKRVEAATAQLVEPRWDSCRH